MKVVLSEAGYERLIEQLLKINENIEDIIDTYSQNSNFFSKKEIKQSIKNHITKVETLFEDLQVSKGVEKFDSYRINELPFIVLGSYFSLIGVKEIDFNCYLSSDNIWNRKNSYIQIFYLSETGFNLLGKEVGESVNIDIGDGEHEYLIKSIRII